MPAYAESEKELESISVSSGRAYLHVGDRTKIKVTAHYSDGTAEDISHSSKGTVYFPLSKLTPGASKIKIEADGTVEATHIGEKEAVAPEMVVVSYQGQKRALVFMVQPDSPIRVEVEKRRLVVGEGVQLKVWKRLDDGTRQEITQGRTGTQYKTLSEIVATVSPDGLVAAVGSSMNPAVPKNREMVLITIEHGGYQDKVSLEIVAASSNK